MGALLRQPEFVTKLADRDAQPRRRDHHPNPNSTLTLTLTPP